VRELYPALDSVAQHFRHSANQLWQFLQRYFAALLWLIPDADDPWGAA
jgi:hypothetical protein